MQKHVARMTLREKCAQRIFVDFRFDAPDYDRLMRLIKKEGVGGVRLHGGSLFDVTPLVNSFQRAARYPLLIASDFEDGAGQQVSGATVFPPNMAVGAAGSEDLALVKGRHTGIEARLLGVPWVLSPVVDVHRDPFDPAVGTRSFGRDPEAVGRLGRATLRGLHAAGVLGCAKGFPGAGDGSGGPFAELAPEADAVMVGNFRVPAMDPDAPASLSRAVLEDHLRGKLGFQGLIAVDRLAEVCAEREAVERAALAGADVLLGLGDPDLAIQALEEAAKAGRLPEAAVDLAADRILQVKETLGLFRERMTDVRSVENLMKNEAHRAGAQKIADAAVTLVRGTGRVEEAAEVLTIRDLEAAGDLTVFEKELARKVKIRPGARPCVAAVFFRPRPGSGKVRLDEAQVERVREAGRRCGEILVVSFGSPSAIREFPEAAGVVCAYGEDESCQRAAARALLGEIPCPGRLPVAM
jgi:beta-glucosidase-like glycosyl hydrolase